VAILVLIVSAALIFIEVKAGHGFFAGAGILLGLGGTYLLVYGVGWSPSPFGFGQYVVMGVVAAVMVIGFIYLARVRRSLMSQPKLVDPTLVVNKTGSASTDILPGMDGVANVSAEDWTAVSDEPIEKGTPIRVKSYEDGKVRVEKLPPSGSGKKGTGKAA
jgi:membrane-bound ClpP family serine protease